MDYKGELLLEKRPSGWLPWRSPFGVTKTGLGRAFIFGFYPGVLIGGKFDLKKGEISEESKMLKGYVELMKKYPEFLLSGKMVGEVGLKGSDSVDVVNEKGEKYPVKWFTAQGIAWNAESGNDIVYTLANLSDKSQHIKIKLIDGYGESLENNSFILDQEIKEKIIPGKNGLLTLQLAPWQLSVIKQSSNNK